MHVCDKFPDLIGILEVTIDYEACLSSIYEILLNLCSNLKQLIISGEFRKSMTYKEEVVLAELPPKGKLTSFTLTCNMVTPFLTSLVQEVVNASPNLSKLTLPWGFYPDLSNSKSLSSLTIAPNYVRPRKMARAHDKLSQLLNMLAQVSHQLVTLSFGCGGINIQDKYKLVEKSAFRVPRRMSKLKYFRNDMMDIFECGDFLENITSVETLVMGKPFTCSSRLDEVLQDIFDANKTLASVRNLSLRDIQDARLLDGLKTTFPNLERLELDTYYQRDWHGDLTGMKLGVVLNACKGWESLKHLKLALPKSPSKMMNVLHALMEGSELYKGMNWRKFLYF